MVFYCHTWEGIGNCIGIFYDCIFNAINIQWFCSSNRMKAAIDEMSPGNNVVIKLSEDGSGRGAAMVAAVARRLAE